MKTHNHRVKESFFYWIIHIKQENKYYNAASVQNTISINSLIFNLIKEGSGKQSAWNM